MTANSGHPSAILGSTISSISDTSARLMDLVLPIATLYRCLIVVVASATILIASSSYSARFVGVISVMGSTLKHPMQPNGFSLGWLTVPQLAIWPGCRSYIRLGRSPDKRRIRRIQPCRVLYPSQLAECDAQHWVLCQGCSDNCLYLRRARGRDAWLRPEQPGREIGLGYSRPPSSPAGINGPRWRGSCGGSTYDGWLNESRQDHLLQRYSACSSLCRRPGTVPYMLSAQGRNLACAWGKGLRTSQRLMWPVGMSLRRDLQPRTVTRILPGMSTGFALLPPTSLLARYSRYQDTQDSSVFNRAACPSAPPFA